MKRKTYNGSGTLPNVAMAPRPELVEFLGSIQMVVDKGHPVDRIAAKFRCSVWHLLKSTIVASGRARVPAPDVYRGKDAPSTNVVIRKVHATASGYSQLNVAGKFLAAAGFTKGKEYAAKSEKGKITLILVP